MFDIIEVLIVFLGGVVIGWCSFFFGIIPTDDDEKDDE